MLFLSVYGRDNQSFHGASTKSPNDDTTLTNTAEQ